MTDSSATHCQTCGGTGQVPCHSCAGAGSHAGFPGTRGTYCAVCGGTGVRHCPRCSGSGRIRDFEFEVHGSDAQEAERVAKALAEQGLTHAAKKGNRVEAPMPEPLSAVFISHAADTLADTNLGLSGPQIVKLTAAYSLEWNVPIPHERYPFANSVPNKRTPVGFWRNT